VTQLPEQLNIAYSFKSGNI